ncbi:hypothetical protein H3C70_03900 [Patescibacteria group bacterium]|nr:hypothetical protein [Patescibacteria group bacterium]
MRDYHLSFLGRYKWQNILYGVLALAVVGLACFTRLTNIYSRTQWFDDSARDIMIAKRINEDGKFSTVRPLANASGGVLKNSYVYYNALAVLWSFGHDKMSVILGFTVLGLLSLLAGWEIGRQVGGKWLGLVCLFALAVNVTLSQFQLSVYQRNTLPSLSLVVVMLGIWAWNCVSLRRAVLLLLTFTFGVLLHYSLLTMLPAVLVVTGWVFIKNQAPVAKKLLVLGLAGVACVSLWLVTTSGSISDFVVYQQETLTAKRISGLDQIWGFHLSLFYAFFQSVYLYTLLSKWMPIVLMVSWGVGATLILKKRTNAPFMVYFLFFSTYFLPHLLFPTSKTFPFGFDYMPHYQSLALLLIPLVLFEVLKKWNLGARILSLEVFCILLLVLEIPALRMVLQPSAFFQELAAAEWITHSIEKDFQQQKEIHGFQRFVLTDFTSWADPGWFLPPFLLFLEESHGRSYSVLRPDGNNLQYTFDYPADVTYLICNKIVVGYFFDDSPAVAEEKCLKPFLEEHLADYMNQTPDQLDAQLLINSADNTLKANVFRISPK